uniref:Uncharacterized protein n=1 Tax=Periophthalmus magnuspinnatus TaxID=409849 RepID=A0A3B4ADR4_9GOBI
MHSKAKSRSCDNYLSIKFQDSESLDSCIQSTLSALYRPFAATASTVLWQLFSVVERQYRGDGLRCFIDFLLPAKRILQIIQQETSFRGLLLYHEGWPLCIQDKVVVQLSPLHKVRLKHGDFYLQIVPLGRKSAKLVIKCLCVSGQALAEINIPESMYGSIFTAEFLQNVTRDRNLYPLQNCLLTTGTTVYRTPWKNVVNPLFVNSTADAIMQARTLSFSTDLSNPGPRRRLSRDSVAFESRRLFRKSYMEALQNPMALGSSSESILEESTDQSTSPTHRDRVGMPSNGPDLHNPREPLSRRQGGRGWLSGEDRPSTPLLYLQRGLRGGDRRSKSLERTNKSAQVKGHRERSSSGGSGSISPKKLMNGYALRFGRLDVEAAFHRSDRRGSKEEP